MYCSNANDSEVENYYGKETYCLAKNIYFESGNQPLAGKIAVAQVVLNRMEHKSYPKDVCGVVYDAKWRTDWRGKEVPVRNMCQFSWFCDGLSDKPREPDSWIEALNRTIVAVELYNNGFDISHGSTHYHYKNVKPYWSTTIEYITTIDDHHFYRWGKG